MGVVSRFIAILAIAAPCAASAAPAGQWQPHVAEASARFGIPQEWILRVMRAESGGRTHLKGRPITSHAGAMGLMQVMPGTYAALARAHGFGRDPHDPRDNILAGTAYLRAMYDRYGYPGLFAAYNAGPGRYEDYLKAGRRLPAETRAYVAKLASAPLQAPSAALRSVPEAVKIAAPGQMNGLGGALFFQLRTRPERGPAGVEYAPKASVFVRLTGGISAAE
ncbi:lytic transglycosylase domain-containing protein [Allosphingosinicella vermicomposti]|uniref:lytic transglycosylase domain-containing protein n=1 Tax=Allosphingosinicella vermicomposti TaxID=614671 RepID=UPI000D0F36F0|nr:lytic transglycosylase domain-containing protein [Allosphingosinicella vermicomposti]